MVIYDRILGLGRGKIRLVEEKSNCFLNIDYHKKILKGVATDLLNLELRWQMIHQLQEESSCLMNTLP